MNPKQSGRRRFLKSSAALAGLAAAGRVLPASGQQTPPQAETPLILPTGLRPLGERSRFEKLTRSGTATNATTPLQDLHGNITPSELHFYVNHGGGILPDFDPSTYRLLIHGMVERPLVYTLDELKRMPAISRPYFLECGSNGNPNRAKTAKTLEEIHGRTSCAEWTGVPLAVLLKEAGVKDGAGWVIAGAADTSRHSSSMPMEKAMSNALVAYAMNGEAIRLENGYPLRLVLPGYYGRITVKWLNQLKVTDQPSMSTQDRHVHVDHSPAGEGAFLMTTDRARQMQLAVYPKSVITFPSGGQQISGRGYCEISGLAWS
ncbi:MAG: molybdopterin-dependent oxidoreductase, partial [Terriglobia bacterium]